ncbi:glycosyltransferase family 9 protein [Methylotenera sp.]|uniref:glycosyltransferase family 9 protein n=1 Tax=Methylotenera sp. TaxID=2051956 RepID=UPI00272EFDEE|nr:glycosyltransferase family 9 protein [Methylotenera sp.]MDP2070949.1 glycosyltransferase family 9 protein [Methylotenera sp.]MDP3005823.1 glycosyltransferase family 9 protein [Methylotenera sp.]
MFKSKMSPNKVLLIATQQIGDVLLSTPLLKSMREAWPNAVIDVLVYRNTSGILTGNPDCNSVIETENHPDLMGYFKLLTKIFRKYDLAVTTQGNDRAHQYAFLAAKKRIGMIPNLMRKHWWKKKICQRWCLLDEESTHTVEQNLRLADLMGINRRYELEPPKLSSEHSFARFNQLLNFNLLTTPYTIIHPLPMWQYKRWTDAGWLSLIEHVLNLGQHVIITGGPAANEQIYCQQLANQFVDHPAGFLHNLAGKTSFAEMSELLAHATAYIGPDTATTHLAAACGTPTLALFGPTNPVKWAPWPKGYHDKKSPWQRYSTQYQLTNNVMLLQGLGDCVPCHKAGCDDHNNSHSQCLDELPASRVIDALNVLLDSKTKSLDKNLGKIIPICASS